MKVLYFLDSIGRGGAEIQALDVCRNAARFDLEMTIATANGGALEDDFRASGAGFEKLDRRFPVDFALVSRLRRIIREKKINIVHGHQAVDGVHLYLAARGMQNVKTVLSFHGFVPDRKNRIALNLLIPRMDANVVVSHALRKSLAETDGFDTKKKFSVIYNGSDLLRLLPSGHSIRSELGIRIESMVFGMVGNFYRSPTKDQNSVCRALRDVFAKLGDAHFIFAGGIEPGAEEKVNECMRICENAGIADRVHFLGSRSDVPDILAALDVFIFSSLREGFGIAATEAMLTGVPTIVSDIEPLLEISQNGNYAQVFPVGDADALAKEMISLGTDLDKRSDLARRAKEFANNNFSIEAHFRELLKLYNSLL